MTPYLTRPRSSWGRYAAEARATSGNDRADGGGHVGAVDVVARAGVGEDMDERAWDRHYSMPGFAAQVRADDLCISSFAGDDA